MDADALDTVLREASGKLLMLARLTGADVLFFCDTIAASYLTLMQKAGLDVAGGGRFRDDFMDRAEVVGSAQDLLDLLAQTLLESFGGLLRARDEMDARPILHAKQYIKENYAQPIHLEDVAAKEGFNPSYFSTLFKKETGRTFKEYLHDVRMGEAKRLLRDTNLPVSAVCECVGYTDLKHFSGSFRQTTGIKPSEFRKLYARGGIS
jgi:two-component system response regulator YesN